MSAALFFFLGLVLSLTAIGGGSSPSHAARREALDLRHVQLRLPGPPATVVTSDLNGDGHQDLAIVLVYTDLENVGVDRIENMVQISTVIPSLFERRELRVFLGSPGAGLEAHGEPLILPPDVLALTAAPDGRALLALTESGVSRLALDANAGSGFAWTELIEDRPVLAGSGSFFSKLTWTHDMNGDGFDDILLPAEDGPAIYLSVEGSVSPTPSQRLTLPGDERGAGGQVWRDYPLPRLQDVDFDGHVDLVSISTDAQGNSNRVAVFLGDGRGTFRSHREPASDDEDCEGAESLVVIRDANGQRLQDDDHPLAHFGDIDGDGRTEWITSTPIEPEKSGMRAEMRNAKRPKHQYRFHRLRDDLSVEATPYTEFVAEGHAFEDVDFGAGNLGLFQDLDADGRADLITVTLRFSMLQAVKVLATKRISIGVDFHVHTQAADGSFRKVEGLDLSEKLRFDLNDLQLNRLAQFGGDFDGDGRTDFVHLGRGTKVTIHRGQQGCTYPKKPDRVIDLEQEPQDLGLVRIADFDGDARSDLAVTRLLEVDRVDVSAPVVLDLYLSKSGS